MLYMSIHRLHVSFEFTSFVCCQHKDTNESPRRTAWVRIADPAAEHTRLSKTSRANIEWLLQCFQADLACPLQSKPILACKAAADACAEGTKVGIGGWFISSRRNQQQWPCLTKEAQRYIACFETLAQLALMRAPRAKQCMHRHRQHRIRSQSEQAVHHSAAFADFCATSSCMSLQAQMVCASLAHPRRTQRVG